MDIGFCTWIMFWATLKLFYRIQSFKLTRNMDSSSCDLHNAGSKALRPENRLRRIAQADANSPRGARHASGCTGTAAV